MDQPLRRSVWIAAILVPVSVAAILIKAVPQEPVYRVPDGSNYRFTGQTAVESGGRTYLLKDVPVNEAEGVVEADFRCPFTGDFFAMARAEASTEELAQNVEIIRQDVAQGRWLQREVVASLTAMPQDKIFKDDRTWAEELAKGYHLTEWCVVEAVYTEQWPEQVLSQFGNGTLRSTRFCGRR